MSFNCRENNDNKWKIMHIIEIEKACDKQSRKGFQRMRKVKEK